MDKKTASPLLQKQAQPDDKSIAYLWIISLLHIAILGCFLIVERVKEYEELVDYKNARGILYGMICILEVIAVIIFLYFGKLHALPLLFTIIVNGVVSSLMIYMINLHLCIGTLSFWVIVIVIILICIKKELWHQVKEIVSPFYGYRCGDDRQTDGDSYDSRKDLA